MSALDNNNLLWFNSDQPASKPALTRTHYPLSCRSLSLRLCHTLQKTCLFVSLSFTILTSPFRGPVRAPSHLPSSNIAIFHTHQIFTAPLWGNVKLICTYWHNTQAQKNRDRETLTISERKKKKKTTATDTNSESKWPIECGNKIESSVACFFTDVILRSSVRTCRLRWQVSRSRNIHTGDR